MNHKTLILFLVGIGILAVMVFFIGPLKIESALKHANPLYVLLAVLIQFFIYGLWTQRWSITIHSLNIRIKKRHIPDVNGGFGRKQHHTKCKRWWRTSSGLYLSKYAKTPLENALATVIADRGLDTFPFVVLAIITIIYLSILSYASRLDSVWIDNFTCCIVSAFIINPLYVH